MNQGNYYAGNMGGYMGGFMINGNGMPSPTPSGQMNMMPPQASSFLPPETPPQSTPSPAHDARFNRGNYRCSRCGEPKKGHVCPYQPANFKCTKCGNLKKSCTCGAPLKCNAEVQCALDEHMTIAKLDLAAQGVTEFHESVLSFVEGASSLS
ncbi:hypothetical protein SDRG_10099 [Saprolegnia diclina VS20]|uniref:Uncharacterized protein n=1 Tax=Saprolegnia diclina (strain VS20) TaxID=1156394 RepID=T0RQJ6_SAPDV|nr:hypothetical protein SDRG_10099 [Saprolegnia diclina VS20]EQC32352.1 hypothetical protein SDRG_10099 [Saprolegnia diclina VS20]|eukprot:XP_008614293.1 hypothetical protein SDRG_10099 [Saprolegnia diclina VS20]